MTLLRTVALTLCLQTIYTYNTPLFEGGTNISANKPVVAIASGIGACAGLKLLCRGIVLLDQAPEGSRGGSFAVIAAGATVTVTSTAIGLISTFLPNESI